jgi:hypothetical protein
MKIAILFWFYKEPNLCRNRLQILRKYNPEAPIFGLYGGKLEEANKYKEILGKYLDAFYTFPQERSPDWKWQHGDLMILDWYRNIGSNLLWDSLVIVQWDMLVIGSINKIFSMLLPDQILLSEIKTIREVERDWYWVNVDKRREKYLNFISHVKNTYDYNQEPLRCIFIVVCLPRIFLDNYLMINPSDAGFIEYRVPIYAQIFKIPFCLNHSFRVSDPYSLSDSDRKSIALHARGQDISLMTIFKHLLNPAGTRIFHPYRSIFPIRKKDYLVLAVILFKDFISFLRLIKYDILAKSKQ